MEETIERRKQKLLNFLKSRASSYFLPYVILIGIIIYGFLIRLRNINLLTDITTGKYVPSDLDALVILRYANEIVQTGALSAVDTLRYYPLGFGSVEAEFGLLSHFIVYLHKLLSFFSSSVTLEFADIIYPPVAFIFIILFFYLFVKKLFDYKIALLASAFLAVVPTFLQRTMLGFSDKEALALALMFMALYFYVAAWKAKKIKAGIIIGIVSGITTAMTGLVWGGVSFIFLTLGLFVLAEIMLDKFSKDDFLVYSSWVVSTVLVLNLFGGARFTFINFITSFTSGVMIFSFFMGVVFYLIFGLNILKLKDRIGEKLPRGIAAFLATVALAFVFIVIFFGFSFVQDKIANLYLDMIAPFGKSRWALTVAESHQPYIRDWINNFGWSYMLLFLGGSVVFFYEMIKGFRKNRLKLTLIYALFILGFTFSRYSSDSVFNGTTTASKVAYIGSLAVFGLLILFHYLYSFYRDKESYKEILGMDKTYTFIFIYLILMIVAGRSAVRLLLILTPITTIFAAYVLVRAFDYASANIKSNKLKFFAYLVILYLAVTSLYAFSSASMAQAQYIGPVYDQQWQVAMDWARKNTAEDAVFAHWWDYGYLVQYGANRATLSDGGNSRGAINHFIGRHLLTGQSDTEALQLLKANNATHLLIVSDEIGKYPAFSSIGADANYDRYSWINTFKLNPKFQEGRDGLILIYDGGTPLDDDFVYHGKLFPAGSSGIGAFLIGLSGVDANNLGSLNGIPEAVIVYNGQQTRVPISCLFVGDRKVEFDNPEALQGCLRIIPEIDQQNMVNPVGAALYLSPDVKKSRFAEYYLFNAQNEYFKLVYSDENSIPLAMYQGRIIGPLKIWEVSYPDDLEVPEEFYGTELPDPRVDLVRG